MSNKEISITNKKRINPAIVILSIAMIFFAVAFFYPFLFVVINSFRPNADIVIKPTGLPNKFFFNNYIEAWKTMEFPKVFLNTLVVTIFGTIGIIFISSMCAYALARSESKIALVIYGLITFAIVIPFQAEMVPLGVLAADLHLMNIPGLTLMYWGLGTSQAVFMMHGFVKGVPKELEESAAIDGAGKFYIFFNIVLPLLKTIIATVAVIDALWLWNDFLLPLIVVKSGTLQLGMLKFNGQFLNNYGAMTAALTLSSIPIVAFYLCLQKYIVKGIAAGAVKG